MRRDTFERRVWERGCWLTYEKDGLEGMVRVWANDGRLVLTWEECRAGKQFEEHEYTRDERYVFDGTEELLRFLEQSGLDDAAFKPN